MYKDAWELSVPTGPVRWTDLAVSGRIEDDTFGTTCGSYDSAEKAGADGHVALASVETPVDTSYVFAVRPMRDAVSQVCQAAMD